VRPLWRGRALALVGILLVAVNLRTAVATMSPIYDQIGRDITLNGVIIGLLGMIPPIMFSLAGILSPRLARSTGLEWALVLACSAMIIGPLLRALAVDASMLGAGTIVALAGAGVGNILIPPAVKKYFPDRIGQMTTVYATIMSIGAALSLLAAAPVALAVGWRGWLMAWAFVGLACAAPWIALALRHRRDLRSGDAVAAVHVELAAPIVRSRLAWMMALAHLVPTVCVYAMFAWLPTIMQSIAGASEVEAGAMLSLFALMGLPSALLAPMLGAKGWTSQLMIGGVLAFVVGFGGLLIAPAAAPWLWTALIGLGPFVFPLLLALFGLRTRSHHAAAQLSGFVQTIGYAGGAIGPILVGALHEVTGDWGIPLAALLGVSLMSVIPAIALRRPVMLEDELAAKAATSAR
jgi:CP family cyanate transporter-like MFS transporter